LEVINDPPKFKVSPGTSLKVSLNQKLLISVVDIVDLENNPVGITFKEIVDGI
jgi:hypothetical protein